MQIDKHIPEQLAQAPCPLIVDEIHAVGITTRKRSGEIAEATFLAKASGLGFGVARPWGDSERYDFILDSGYDLWRVQLKSTVRLAESRYQVKAGGCSAVYTRSDIDFLVAYIIPENLWYVVPIAAFASRKGLGFYPYGEGKHEFEKYRGAWCQMACQRPDGLSPILVHCGCETVRTGKGICPFCG